MPHVHVGDGRYYYWLLNVFVGCVDLRSFPPVLGVCAQVLCLRSVCLRQEPQDDLHPFFRRIYIYVFIFICFFFPLLFLSIYLTPAVVGFCPPADHRGFLLKDQKQIKEQTSPHAR